MSLLSRLWLSVFIAMLLALLGSFALSLLTARNYLEQQLFAQASDSASALALTMTQQGKDAAMRELLVSALFDSGHFEFVRYRDVRDQVAIERRTQAPAPAAPAWFVALLPLDTRIGEAPVSDGWHQAGRVEVRASARYAYAELWSGTLHLLAVFAVVGGALGLAVAALMRWLQRPLRDIVDQAEAIGQRRFETRQLPGVLELRVVGLAMNRMVERVRAMFSEQAARIESLRDEAGRDPLTRLPNRGLFSGALRGALSHELAAPQGVLMMCRIGDLAGINREAGRERTDMLLCACADMLRAQLETLHGESMPGRLNGSDFVILVQQAGAEEARQLGESLLAGFARVALQNGVEREPLVAIGWTGYRRGEEASVVLVRADASLMQAELAAPPLVGSAGEGALPVERTQAWQARLERALAAHAFELARFPVVRADGSLLHHELMLRLVGEEGRRFTAGEFMPVALRHGMIARLDLMTLELALADLRQHTDDVAVNISALSLDDPAFLGGLKAILQRAGGQARRLWIEIAERGISAHGGLDALVPLARLLADSGARLGIEHFGLHFASMPRLHALSVDYLKLDGAFVAGIEQDDGKSRFVRAVVDVAASLDIQVIAERVASEAELHTLARLGVAGMTGTGVALR